MIKKSKSISKIAVASFTVIAGLAKSGKMAIDVSAAELLRKKENSKHFFCLLVNNCVFTVQRWGNWIEDLTDVFCAAFT